MRRSYLSPALLISIGLGLSASPVRADVPTASELTRADWSGIQGAFEAAQLRFHEDAGHAEARNPGQAWSSRFDGRSMQLRPDEGGWSFGLELASYGFEGRIAPVTGTPVMGTEAGRLTYAFDGNLEEWYVNDARGLEHGFTLAHRPAPGDGTELQLHLTVLGGLAPRIAPTGDDIDFADPSGATRLTYNGLFVFDAAGRELPAHFELAGEGLRIAIDESDATYPLTIDPLIQSAYLKAAAPDLADNFGRAVAISGDTVVVGAALEDSDAQGVGGDPSNNFAAQSGAAYVFVRSSGVWTQQAYLKASNAQAGDRFGWSVAIDGNTIVVGAHGESGSEGGVNGDQSLNNKFFAGAAYVFARDPATSMWSQQAYLKAELPGSNDNFGRSVAVAGDVVVVGAPFEDSNATGIDGAGADDSATSAGAAYVFQRSGTTWSAGPYLKASNTLAKNEFGTSVAVADDVLAVGARYENGASTGVGGDQTNSGASQSGAVYVFARSGATWSQEAYVKASNTDGGDKFGTAVAMSGSRLIVGAPGEDSSSTGVGGTQTSGSANASGAAYAFLRSGTSWSQDAYIKASNTGSNDAFGSSLDLDGATLVVGANQEASGTQSDPSDNSSPESGAAYVYQAAGSTWTFDAYLKAPSIGVADSFGEAVGVSAGRVVIGAYREDSSSLGVGGDPFNDGLIDSGAAFLFDPGTSCGVVAYGPALGANIALLASSTPPTAGANFTLTASGFQGSGAAFLVISLGQANLPILGGTLLVDTSLSLFGSSVFATMPVTAGTGQLTLPIPPGTVGLVTFAQAAMLDAGQVAGLAFSNGLAITVCP